jgi:hypothetical protein
MTSVLSLLTASYTFDVVLFVIHTHESVSLLTTISFPQHPMSDEMLTIGEIGIIP